MEYLTPQDVAALLKVSSKSVLRWAKSDPTMPALRIGGSVRFHRDRLERWLAVRTQGPGRRLAQPHDLVKPAPARGLGRLTCQRVSPPALDSQGRGFEGPLDDGAVAERAGLPVTVLGPLLRNQHHGFHRCLPFYLRVFSTVTEIPLRSLASPVG